MYSLAEKDDQRNLIYTALVYRQHRMLSYGKFLSVETIQLYSYNYLAVYNFVRFLNSFFEASAVFYQI